MLEFSDWRTVWEERETGWFCLACNDNRCFSLRHACRHEESTKHLYSAEYYLQNESPILVRSTFDSGAPLHDQPAHEDDIGAFAAILRGMATGTAPDTAITTHSGLVDSSSVDNIFLDFDALGPGRDLQLDDPFEPTELTSYLARSSDDPDTSSDEEILYDDENGGLFLVLVTFVANPCSEKSGFEVGRQRGRMAADKFTVENLDWYPWPDKEVRSFVSSFISIKPQ